MTTAEAGHLFSAYPEWTECRKKTGLDPLGMQNSSISLYQTFLPGISNVTLRMRYYGLYAWLAHSFANEIGDTNPEAWKRYIRRAEALYALVSVGQGVESGVAGIDWAGKRLSASPTGTIEFKDDTEPGSEVHYLKQAWGAFGAAYRSQLYEVGVFDRAADHDIPLPSRPLGEGLAKAFAAEIGSSAALFLSCIKKARVSHKELLSLVPILPSAINHTSRERALYQQILLGESEAQLSPAALSRHLSFRLILKITALLGRPPSAEEVRWVLYAGFDNAGQPLMLKDPPEIMQRDRWWVYHANDLCHIAYEALLKFVLDKLGGSPIGVPLGRLVPDCVDRVLEALDQTPGSWEEFIYSMPLSPNPFDSNDPHSEAALSEAVIKAGRSDKSLSTPVQAARAIMLLGTLHRRVAGAGLDLKETLGSFNPDAFRSLLSEIGFLDRSKSEPFRQLLESLLERRIIRRHLWVALRKLRHQGDYTFLIEADEGRLRLRDKDGPVYTNPRLGPAITFLRDIGLVDQSGLTPLGRQAAGI